MFKRRTVKLIFGLILLATTTPITRLEAFQGMPATASHWGYPGDLYGHLISHGFTAAQLAGLSHEQLLALHDRDHQSGRIDSWGNQYYQLNAPSLLAGVGVAARTPWPQFQAPADPALLRVPAVPAPHLMAPSRRQSRRYRVIHFASPLCDPCQRMNRTVFLDPRFQTDIAKLVSVAHVDTMSDPFSAQKYGIRALPADIVIDETGTIVARRTGECSFEQYRAFVSTYSTTASSSDPSPAASGVQNATVAASPRNVELFGLTWLADLGAAQRLASQKKRALIVWVYRYAFAPWNAFVEKTVEREEDALEMMTESLQEQLQDVFVVIHAGNQALPANQHFMSQNMHALYAGVSLFVRRPDGTSFEGISPAYNSVAELKRWFSEQVAPYESHSASPYGVPPGKSSETTSAGSGRVWAD